MSKPALSPSRAADFKQCPLLYRFRAIDRLPEASTVAQLRGFVDRIDVSATGALRVVDYKTGRAPSGSQVEAGYALQLGTLGLMVEHGGFERAAGKATQFEYWSLARSDKSETGFGSIATPLRVGNKRSGIPPEDFLPQAKHYLDDALDKWILGSQPFTARLNPDAPGYATYDQLMRLDEWVGRQ
jgi:ATP-dependent helicase/nuclease subunit B